MKIVSDIKTLQALQLSILIYVDRVCTRHGLRYYLVGGTLLGAIRHQGFIPWDDDIDIGMPRCDYERFIRVMEQGGESPYHLYYIGCGGECFQTHCKVYDERTVCLTPAGEPALNEPGVALDIFAYDGYGNAYEAAVTRFMRAHGLQKAIAMSGRDLPPSERTLKRSLIHLACCVIGKDRFYKAVCTYLRRRGVDRSQYVAGTNGWYGSNEVQPASGFTKQVPVTFEGRTFPAPAGWEPYLRSLYGDYMQLPPVEQRVRPHHYDVYLKDGAVFPELAEA